MGKEFWAEQWVNKAIDRATFILERIEMLAQSMRLEGFQADFSFLLGAGFAHPDHAATLRVSRVFIEDKFDHLAAPKSETSAQSESLFRGIQDQAGKSFLVAVQINDQAGAPFQQHPLRAAAFGDREAAHSYTHGLGVVMVRRIGFTWKKDTRGDRLLL